MLYLNTKDIQQMGIDWEQTIAYIEQAVNSFHEEDYAQPIKPYLRFRDPAIRIIAMPSFIGGDINAAGIKWISSFPKNPQIGIQRAHSVTILNETETGKPFAFINTALVSGIRTASVSGLVIQYFEKTRNRHNMTVGIVGFGPIGRLHLQMVHNLLGDRINKIYLFDIKGIQSEFIPEDIKERTVIAKSWEEAYLDSDLFITCTVSSNGYIDKKPKDGALLLNVSLRDFKPSILEYTNAIYVDDWDEVCRENTDIENMHLQKGLQKEDTKSIADIVCFEDFSKNQTSEAVIFNPMGMSIFDLATATYYYRKALDQGIGITLPE
ncbi:2,3-diaminopropionate biosynthesis protein SbnB [Paenibacillus larvae subsp. pulvifaciens]|uniref:Ornithine cyclodeaminase n=3 Tax=Paenibacillus larvae TaxID=1464 RepID=A0A2L1U0X1_9BACL|nr:2,3-diaminopropionate biosynthesis protein SbnB [Paenibacillus larvae]AQT83367.1 2,3-diaminopropionate biosynthesis protein SbnB [Paenibacillus larvae subsp. pulvifaciens]ARF70184.1 2,3-diaminopropionate biosynthesis protein SbnB [Paenibacillus larvae subsp. pulvifaciens]AVF26518.1 ornithine cyclodeaminase [Paenibacillus larvae subsp. larvae]MCY7521631.1 2,3-diaminopropionate biosynthesis protein SbnB [Paenibacillus larvae]MCY9502132.1 2,3-diaminopropionate biosynthesis protein SbnB [Paenib